MTLLSDPSLFQDPPPPPPPPPDENIPSSRSYHLFVTCRVIFGPDNIPSIIMFCLYAILTYFILQILINDISIKHIRKIPSKIISLACLFAYLFYKSLLYVVPFPFSVGWSNLFCNQLPRVVLFASWHCLGIFFLNAFLFPNVDRRYLNIFYTFLILFLALMLALAIATSIYQSSMGEHKHTNDDILSIASTVYYFTLSLWVTAYAIRIVHILVTLTVPLHIRRALIQFSILFGSFTLIFWFRCIWAFLVAIHHNSLNESLYTRSENCYNDGDDCLLFTFTEQLFYFFVDYLPSALLVRLFYITRSKRSEKKKKRANAPDVYNSRSQGATYGTYSADSGDYYPDWDETSSYNHGQYARADDTAAIRVEEGKHRRKHRRHHRHKRRRSREGEEGQVEGDVYSYAPSITVVNSTDLDTHSIPPNMTSDLISQNSVMSQEASLYAPTISFGAAPPPSIDASNSINSLQSASDQQQDQSDLTG